VSWTEFCRPPPPRAWSTGCLQEFAVALQRIARAAGFVVGFPKVQCCFGLIAANAGDFQGGVDLHRQLAASLGNPEGLIVTPAASCFGAFTIGAPDGGAPTDEALSSRFRDSTRFMLELMTDHLELWS
jgi:Fe-S oxidoreductase